MSSMDSKIFYDRKRILITGAGSGIGGHLALRLSDCGARLSLVDIDPLALSALKGTLGKNPSHLYLVGDVRDQNAMKAIADRTLSAFDGIDIVIASAGLACINPAIHFSFEIDREVMSVNYFGVVNTFVPFIPKMIEQKSGSLVAIASLAALRGLPQTSSYCASKSALAKLIEGWRLELKGFGLHVSCVFPGFVDTPMSDHQEFKTPFKVPVSHATHRILNGIVKRRSRIVFPWTLYLLIRFGQLLPLAAYEWLYERLDIGGRTGGEGFPKMLGRSSTFDCTKSLSHK